MHTAVMAAEAVCILNLIVLFISKLRGEKTHRTSVAFIICLGVESLLCTPIFLHGRMGKVTAFTMRFIPAYSLFSFRMRCVFKPSR